MYRFTYKYWIGLEIDATTLRLFIYLVIEKSGSGNSFLYIDGLGGGNRSFQYGCKRGWRRWGVGNSLNR